MYTQQVGYGSVPGWCRHWRCRYRHHTFMCHKYHVSHTSKQCRLERLKSGSKKERDAGAYARPMEERSLVRGGGRYNQGSFAKVVHFAKGCWGWVFAGVHRVVWCGCEESRCP